MVARVRLSGERVRGEFVRKVEELSGQNLLACNQCGKCSAGCPAATVMDLLPNQVIRYAGSKEHLDLRLLSDVLRPLSARCGSEPDHGSATGHCPGTGA
jgi:heterodisulfide reductase subunit C